jgi:tetratricopeptide (TPR) repeat protein
MLDLAKVYIKLFKYNEAEALLKEAVESRKIILGEAHPDTVSSVIQLADFYAHLKYFEKGESILKEVIMVHNEYKLDKNSRVDLVVQDKK